jgi:hypothetical protein
MAMTEDEITPFWRTDPWLCDASIRQNGWRGFGGAFKRRCR